MVLKLHKIDASPPVRAAMMVSDLLNAPVEFVECNLMEREHLKEEYIKKNPLHTVPMLEDDDLIIHDSHAIITYLADGYGKNEKIYPKDLKQRTLVDQKLYFNNSILFPRLRNYTYFLFFHDQKTLTEQQAKDIEESYSFMEQFLSKNKFLALDHITLADIAAYATLSSTENILSIDSSKYPKLTAWMAEMEKQPYAKKYNAPGVAILAEAVKAKRGV